MSEGVPEIDYDRWYRELFKKFTTIRDVFETYNIQPPPAFGSIEKMLQNLEPNDFGRVSKIINKAFCDIPKIMQILNNKK
jgi:hypothetical protein